MTSANDVMVYGASGYTGKLMAWHLAEYQIPFTAAGRSEDRLREQMAAVPECANHDYEIRRADHDRASLTELFKDSSIVFNVVGPFMELAEPAVQAALDAGCHYFDTTGEAEWMRYVGAKYGPEFERKGLALCPAASYMWASGGIAAEIALEHDGVDSLEILYFADSDTSLASTKSFLSMCTRDQYFIERGEMRLWPRATSYDVVSPDSHMVYKALPWSGGGETIWYENDDRVRNCATLVALKNQGVYQAVMGVLTDFEEKYSALSIEEQQKITNEIGESFTPEEPAREIPTVNRHVTSCVGRGNRSGTRVIFRGNSPYAQTGLLAAEIARRVSSGRLRRAGFVSPALAFGARELAACLSEWGYLDWEVSRW